MSINYRPLNRFRIHFIIVNATLTTINSADYKFAKRVWFKGWCKNGDNDCEIYLASYLFTLLDIVFKNTYKSMGYLGWIWFIIPHCFI